MRALQQFYCLVHTQRYCLVLVCVQSEANNPLPIYMCVCVCVCIHTYKGIINPPVLYHDLVCKTDIKVVVIGYGIGTIQVRHLHYDSLFGGLYHPKSELWCIWRARMVPIP